MTRRTIGGAAQGRWGQCKIGCLAGSGWPDTSYREELTLRIGIERFGFRPEDVPDRQTSEML